MNFGPCNAVDVRLTTFASCQCGTLRPHIHCSGCAKQLLPLAKEPKDFGAVLCKGCAS